MNIGLMGFELKSANKGCEALSYAFIDFLDKHYGDKEIHIYVLGNALGDLPAYYPNLIFEYVPNKLRDIKCKFIRTMIKCDLVFDVTMGDSFSDIYSVNYCLGLISKKRRVELFNHQYILMPQTYGPFTNEEVKKKAISVINKANTVISRDRASIEYLRSLKITRDIEEQIDLAFMLPFEKEKYRFDNTKKHLGINVSGLLWKGGFKNNNQFDLTIDYKEFIRSLLKKYSNSTQWSVHLIPHVIDLENDAYDDDYSTLIMLHNEFPNTLLAPAFNDPIDAKSYIANMDCFIGARMHSTIAAISSGIAVIPVSYSRKFEGLFDTLDYSYLIHGRSCDTMTAISKAIGYIDNYSELQLRVNEIKPAIDSKVELLQNLIRSLLNSI